MISLNGIDKIIKKGPHVVHALKGITLNVPRGEILGVIGHKGAGKSALIRTINFLDPPSRGSVVIDQCDLGTLSTEALREARRHIGMIFSHVNLLQSKTVFENVAFPLELSKSTQTEKEERIHTVLTLTGLIQEAETDIQALTPEQKQRVAIARALVNDPKVLLCEEVTAFLNNIDQKAIIKLLREINQQLKLTLLIITHDVNVIKMLCDKVAVLDKGEIVEQNTVQKWYQHPKTTVSKTLIRLSTQSELPLSLRNRLVDFAQENTHAILRLSFQSMAAEEPFINLLIQKFQLSVNIVQAHLENFYPQSIGIMIVEIIHAPKDLTEIIQFLEHKEVHSEVMGYAIRTP